MGKRIWPSIVQAGTFDPLPRVLGSPYVAANHIVCPVVSTRCSDPSARPIQTSAQSCPGSFSLRQSTYNTHLPSGDHCVPKYRCPGCAATINLLHGPSSRHRMEACNQRSRSKEFPPFDSVGDSLIHVGMGVPHAMLLELFVKPIRHDGYLHW